MVYIETLLPRTKTQQLQCLYNIDKSKRLKQRILTDDEKQFVNREYNPHHNRLKVLLQHGLVPISRYEQEIVECLVI